MAESAAVFRKGQANSEESDVWDDTALIEAYDDAVNAMKFQLEQQGLTNPSGRKSDLKVKKKKKPKKKGNKNKQWRVGDRCQVVYTDDGELYHAVIKSVNVPDRTCVVRFIGYGDEETYQFEDLIAAATPQLPPANAPDSDQMSLASNDFASPQSFTNPKHPKEFSMPGLPFPPPPTLNGFAGQSLPFMPPMGFQNFPPGASGLPQMPMSFPSFPPGAAGLPQMTPHIPPPPPVSDEEDLEADSGALHSMLISWYMSGYHTGYYQGLRAGKNATTRQKPTKK